eukprot:scaffold57355_cov13-Tisochrysis_lutea.AAC.1
MAFIGLGDEGVICVSSLAWMPQEKEKRKKCPEHTDPAGLGRTMMSRADALVSDRLSPQPLYPPHWLSNFRAH